MIVSMSPQMDSDLPTLSARMQGFVGAANRKRHCQCDLSGHKIASCFVVFGLPLNLSHMTFIRLALGHKAGRADENPFRSHRLDSSETTGSSRFLDIL
jgi:hypothetical protein